MRLILIGQDMGSRGFHAQGLFAEGAVYGNVGANIELTTMYREREL
jgi:hypothetical protein